MKILYAIQGTGNGHLTRAYAMAAEFAQREDLKVDYLISGRSPSALFEMQAFGDFSWRQGLSFATRGGRVSLLGTVSKNPWLQFWQDVKELNLSSYDLVVTDFEPVAAWAAKRQGVPCVGLGRQYAFQKHNHQLPINSLQRAMLKQFAPCDTAIGTHWQEVPELVPPLLGHALNSAGHGRTAMDIGHFLVYLPFESLAKIKELLAPFNNFRFSIFHPQATRMENAHCQYYPPSRQGFAEVFSQVQGVISNAGFETSSEALALGKKLLVKPLSGQFEQYANAHCLAEHDLASVMFGLDRECMSMWLRHAIPAQIKWPDIAPQLVNWLADGADEPVRSLSLRLWGQEKENRQATA
ncbi:glycosyltransferase [Aliidiomarina minuta]|uniref:Glycosyltransferase n=1 Tax=Aliidiomarina minuta TaxID=880057 RepID=A0A432WA61_9GAMM|nr:glycosyltransferase family protein [Aliidiomarina minuta]RUO27040.1 glycosyltransferase [Aliidiomarina minuta]